MIRLGGFGSLGIVRFETATLRDWRKSRHRAGLRGYVQPMTTTLLERHVLAKPYFDQAGLIVAVEDDRPVAFAHAGFGPTEDESAVSHELGDTLLAIVAPHPDEAKIAAELIARCEAYLRAKGAKVLYGGGVRPLNSFYLGLYGGSEMPGILDSDPQQQAFFRAAGYREIDRTVVLHRELAGFRTQIDRQQMQLRRTTRVECIQDPASHSWWEACTVGEFPRTIYQLYLRDQPDLAATATLIDMEAFSHTWGAHRGDLRRVGFRAASPARHGGVVVRRDLATGRRAGGRLGRSSNNAAQHLVPSNVSKARL